MRKKLLVLTAALLLNFPAFAQSVQQSGTVTRNHVPVWNTSGVIGDGGTSVDSPISSLGVTNEGGAGFCVSSQRVTAAGRQQFCINVGTNSGATVSLQNFGTAPTAPLNFVVDGISYPFPGSLSQLIINTTPVVGGNTGNCLYVNGSVVGQQTCAASSITGLTGDGIATGPGNVPLTLATVNGNVGTFGSTTVVPLVTVNAKGLITAISNATILISANSQLTGPTLNGAITASSLTSVGTIGTGVWQGTVITPTFGGTGVNNGASTLTLAAALTTTGTGAPTLAFPNTTAFTYTFQGSSDTMVGRATTDTLINKTLTSPIINAGALSGTFTGTPAFSGANFITNANIVQAAAATLIGNPTASLANQSAFTVNGLTDITTPSSTLDFLLILNHTTGTLQKTTANELITASGGGVTSIAGNAGAFTLNGTSGLTNTVNDIKCSASSSSQLGCSEVDNTSISAAAGVHTTIAATKAQQQTGTDNNVNVKPAHQQDHDSAAKAWCNWTGGTAGTNACNAGYNVTNVTRNSGGNYTVNFTTAFASSSYSCEVSTYNTTAGTLSMAQTFAIATGTIGVAVFNTSFTPLDPTQVNIACFGRQ